MGLDVKEWTPYLCRFLFFSLFSFFCVLTKKFSSYVRDFFVCLICLSIHIFICFVFFSLFTHLKVSLVFPLFACSPVSCFFHSWPHPTQESFSAVAILFLIVSHKHVDISIFLSLSTRYVFPFSRPLNENLRMQRSLFSFDWLISGWILVTAPVWNNLQTAPSFLVVLPFV